MICCSKQISDYIQQKDPKLKYKTFQCRASFQKAWQPLIIMVLIHYIIMRFWVIKHSTFEHRYWENIFDWVLIVIPVMYLFVFLSYIGHKNLRASRNLSVDEKNSQFWHSASTVKSIAWTQYIKY